MRNGSLDKLNLNGSGSLFTATGLVVKIVRCYGCIPIMPSSRQFAGSGPNAYFAIPFHIHSSTMKLALSIARFVLPSAYLLGGAGLWISFVNSPPDGLANVGLVLYTLPAFIIGKLFTSLDFPFFEGNYYDAHRAYFLISVGLITLLLFASLTLLYVMVPRRRSV